MFQYEDEKEDRMKMKSCKYVLPLKNVSISNLINIYSYHEYKQINVDKNINNKLKWS